MSFSPWPHSVDPLGSNATLRLPKRQHYVNHTRWLCLGVMLGISCTPSTSLPSVRVPSVAKPDGALRSEVTQNSVAPSPKPLLAIDWSHVHLESESDALALWQQIAPTGADWELRLGELPADETMQKKLAIALLRQGRFECAAPTGCGVAPGLEVDPAATLADPCLRRQLALWAFDRLDDDDAVAIERELISIVGLPPPEEDLVREAFGLVPLGRDDLLLAMIEAARVGGQSEIADESLQWLSESAVLDVATRLHSDGAVMALDPTTARAVFLSAITDGKLKVETRISAIGELVALDDVRLRKDLRAALALASKDARCEVAATAARVLANAGEARFVPKPARGSVAAALRALCVMANYVQEDIGADPSLRQFVSRRGLQVFDHAPALSTPDEPNGEFIPPGELVTLPFLEELAEALQHCAGTSCRASGTRFVLTLDPDRTLRRIERFADPEPCSDKLNE
jgi:hypothetical protein